jgi:hypothetical protein
MRAGRAWWRAQLFGITRSRLFSAVALAVRKASGAMVDRFWMPHPPLAIGRAITRRRWERGSEGFGRPTSSHAESMMALSIASSMRFRMGLVSALGTFLAMKMFKFWTT